MCYSVAKEASRRRFSGPSASVERKGARSVETPILRVQTLGDFSIRRGEAVFTAGRSRKLCLLLAALMWERRRAVAYRELLDLLWTGERGGSLNALKALLHRARAALEEVGGGRPLILSRPGGCQWDPEVPLLLDAEGLPRLLASERLEDRCAALALYQGDFLPLLSGHPWAEERRGRLRGLYLEGLSALLSALEAAGRWQEIASLTDTACALAPCREDLCHRRMEALLRLGRNQEAAAAYETLHTRLLSQSGVLPSQSLRDLHRRALEEGDPRALSPATVLDALLEPPRPGAQICGFEDFRAVCRNAARAAGRDGRPVHVALLTVSGGPALARRSLDRAMDHLETVLLEGLRRGDAAACCGADQFLVLLPHADYDSSRAVCARLARAFTRRYPHAPVRLTCFVQPLSSQAEPDTAT